MKKLLLIFMLVLLPVQFTWAEAAAYCQHEKEPTVGHFGHHSHQHEATDSAPDQKDNTFKVHGDCGYCHLASQASFVATLPLSIVVNDGGMYFYPYRISFSSFIAEGPRRPDRHPVA